ncbi:hypothetical protein [Microbacterium testaceum]|uniref:hypothetical protein n=1 Tax=Microbacterium testaceum TaxID=2033 RepID=UPI0024359918|nr:hypothetical protein [Microbacterium testaceum]
MSNIINAGIFVATVIAAIIAWRGVRDAQRARDDASDHETKALGYAEEASAAATAIAGAQQRAATALEQANLRETARDAAKVPWVVERRSTERWAVRNNTGSDADFVSFEAHPPAHVEMEDGLEFRDVPNGQMVFLRFGGGFSDPSSATLTVVWRDSLREGREATVILG